MSMNLVAFIVLSVLLVLLCIHERSLEIGDDNTSISSCIIIILYLLVEVMIAVSSIVAYMLYLVESKGYVIRGSIDDETHIVLILLIAMFYTKIAYAIAGYILNRRKRSHASLYALYVERNSIQDKMKTALECSDTDTYNALKTICNVLDAEIDELEK